MNRVQHEFADMMLALAEEQKRLAEAQRHTDERLNALIAVLDGIIRHPPPPPGA